MQYDYAPNIATSNLNDFINSLTNIPGFAPLSNLLTPAEPSPEEEVAYVSAPPPPSLASRCAYAMTVPTTMLYSCVRFVFDCMCQLLECYSQIKVSVNATWQLLDTI